MVRGPLTPRQLLALRKRVPMSNHPDAYRNNDLWVMVAFIIVGVGSLWLLAR